MENEELLDQKLEENQIVSSSFEIKYKSASVFHRMMANTIDFLLFIVLLFALFLLCRNITVNSSSYQKAYKAYREEQIKSSLYVDDKSELLPTVIEYIADGDYTQAGKHHKSKEAVESFYQYCLNNMDQEEITLFEDGLKEYLLDDELVTEEGEKYILDVSFESSVLTITENETAGISEFAFYSEVYKPLINNELLSFFANYSTVYLENITYVAKLFVLIDLPISYLGAGLLVYLVPPLFLRRGRQTLGKALYHIGLVGPDYLSLKSGRFLARFAVFYFLELILSIFTLLIPILVSITMMLCSSKKQNFPDYMTKTREVDCSRNKIYHSKEEIVLSGIPGNKKPVDFKPERGL